MAAIDRSVYVKATVALIACAASSGVRRSFLPLLFGVAFLAKEPQLYFNHVSISLFYFSSWILVALFLRRFAHCCSLSHLNLSPQLLEWNCDKRNITGTWRPPTNGLQLHSDAHDWQESTQVSSKLSTRSLI
jgi:hypothetical protein